MLLVGKAFLIRSHLCRDLKEVWVQARWAVRRNIVLGRGDRGAHVFQQLCGGEGMPWPSGVGTGRTEQRRQLRRVRGRGQITWGLLGHRSHSLLKVFVCLCRIVIQFLFSSKMTNCHSSRKVLSIPCITKHTNHKSTEKVVISVFLNELICILRAK